MYFSIYAHACECRLFNKKNFFNNYVNSTWKWSAKLSELLFWDATIFLDGYISSIPIMIFAIYMIKCVKQIQCYLCMKESYKSN